MNELSNQELAAMIRQGDAAAQTEAIARLIEALPNQGYHFAIKSLDSLSLTALARLRVEIDRKIDGKVCVDNWEQSKKKAADMVEALEHCAPDPMQEKKDYSQS